MAANKLRFGTFEVDLQARELRRNGLKLKLQEQPFQILASLLERPCEVVSREELRRRLWPEDTFVDFDNSLNAAVNRLREALGDDADNPRFIETLPRRGYRFIAAVQDLAPTEAATPSPPVPPPHASGLSKLWIAAVAVFVSGLCVVGYFQFRNRVSGASAAPPAIHALAVLPLQNLSGDPEQDYFAEGMTDELITDLAKLRAVRVISRTSTSRFKGSKKPLPEIARELGVDAIIEGSVTRSADRVHLTAQLILTRPERHFWAESYDRPNGDIVKLQDELAKDIANAIRGQIQPGLRNTPRELNAEAHELYLKGRYLWNKRDGQSLSRATEYFQQAIAKEPNYAVAYSGLADAYLLLGGYGYSLSSETLPKARAAAELALRLDEGLAEAHTSLGLIETQDGWNWERARHHFERAIELNPNYATAHHWYGDGYLIPMGRLDEAIAELRKAHELDPLSPIIATDVGKGLYIARRYDEAIAQLRQVLEVDPQFWQAHSWLKDALLEQGKYAEAQVEMDLTIANRGHPEQKAPPCAQAYVLARAGQTRQARTLLREYTRQPRHDYVDAGCFALAHTALGEKDQAFAYLEQAYAAHSSYMTSLKVWPAYDPLRSDPRFAELQRRVGLQ